MNIPILANNERTIRAKNSVSSDIRCYKVAVLVTKLLKNSSVDHKDLYSLVIFSNTQTEKSDALAFACAQ